MIVAGNEMIGPIRRQNFRSFRFFTADTQAGLGWNVMKNIHGFAVCLRIVEPLSSQIDFCSFELA